MNTSKRITLAERFEDFAKQVADAYYGGYLVENQSSIGHKAASLWCELTGENYQYVDDEE